jgi:hypothetical protein
MSTQFSSQSDAGFHGAETSTPTERKTLWQRARHGWPASYPLICRGAEQVDARPLGPQGAQRRG